VAYKVGNKWRGRVRRVGLPAQTEIFRTKAAAERWERKTLADFEDGHQPPSIEARRMTLADALDKYEKEVTPDKRGAAQEGYRIKLWRKQDLAAKHLTAVTSTDVAAFRKARKKEGKRPNTIRLELALLSNLYTVARTEWGMARLPNPVADTKKPSVVGSKRRRRLNPGGEGPLLWACRKTGPRWLAPLVVFAIETAMRRGEIAAMRAAWVKGAIVEIPLTKNGEPRRVPLSPRAQIALVRVRKALGGADKAMPSIYTISAYFKRAADAAGLADLHFHDMRREGTSRLFERGLGIEEVAAITGHKTWAILADYTKPIAENLVKKLAKKRPAEASL
jgi:integrase